jgi:hypothetical protein
MSDTLILDHDAIRAMVEDFWRSFLATARTNPTAGQKSIMRFEDHIQTTAGMMPQDQAATFLQAIEEERESLFQEYNRDPDGLKARLGLPVDRPSRSNGYHRRSLGDVAARTVVRATIWESISALFRLLR